MLITIQMCVVDALSLKPPCRAVLGHIPPLYVSKSNCISALCFISTVNVYDANIIYVLQRVKKKMSVLPG